MTWQGVGERRAYGGSCPARAPRFVGREQEFAALSRVLASPPAVCLIEGEAGIGKSRLLREYLASPAGRAHKALVASCPPIRQPHTLGPVIDALRQATDGIAGLPLTNLAGSLRPFFPEWAADLPPPPEHAEDATVARHRLFRALRELIGSLKVTMVVVEDAHWADEATLEFLIYEASREARQISVVVTQRSEDVSAGSLLRKLPRLAAGTGGLRLILDPLDMAGTGALMSSMLAGQQVSAEFAAFVHSRTEGLPLAVEESVRLMADRADLSRHDGEWVRRHLAEIAVPPTVRDAVLERADRLSDDARAMLRATAVLAEAADEAMLAAISAQPAGRVRAGLAEALHSGLLAEDAQGFVSFRHELAGQAVHEALPGPERRMLHLRAGRALEDRPAPRLTRLARHFREAGDTGRWSTYAEQAADLALASGDETTAAILVRDLMDDEALLDGRRAVRLLRKISSAPIADPAYYRHLEYSIRSWLDTSACEPAEEAEVHFHLGRILGYMDEHEKSRVELERAIPHLVGNPPLAARAMSMLGWPQCSNSRASTHRRWLRRAALAASSLTQAERLPVLADRATALLLLGEEAGWPAAAQVIDEATVASDTKQVAVVELNRGDMAMLWGRYTDAEKWLMQAMDLAKARGYRRYRGLILATQAHLDWFTGAWEGLAERASLLADDEEGPPPGRFEAVLVTSLLHFATGGSPAQAEDRLRKLLAALYRQGAPRYTMEPAGGLARLLLAEGRIEDALQVTGEPVAIVAAKGIWVWATEVAPSRVEALIAAGRIDEAAGLAADFARGLRGRDAPAPWAALKLCRAILAGARGQHVRGAALFGEAAVAWQSLPRPYDALLAQERQAGCLLEAGDQDAGTGLLTTVCQDLRRLGATGDAARVARRLREQQVPPLRSGHGGRPGYGSQLSPRELDVARLLVAGGTNREIGQQLFLSPKTVARHLDSAMRKLGVSSRTALAVRLVSDGIVSGARPS